MKRAVVPRTLAGEAMGWARGAARRVLNRQGKKR